jgi:hypothetical protein
MAEVNGESLSDVLENRRIVRNGRQSLAAVYLAGKWLRRFQSLPTYECEKYEGTSIDHQADGPHLGLTVGAQELNRLLVGQLLAEQGALLGVDNIIEYCELRIRSICEAGDSWLSASLHQRISRTLAKLIERSNRKDLSSVWSHGDYGPGNMIWDGHKLTPIDFAMAHADYPLADVTYFVHRLNLVRAYRPWRRWPIEVWNRAFLRGYNRPNAAQDPMYSVCMIRHGLCGLAGLVRRPSKTWKQSLHNRWVQGCLRRRLEHYCS